MFKHRIALALAALTVASVSPAFAETQPPPGTNVGELACRNFLGGKLRLDSEPSKGARIHLVLPRAAQPSKFDPGLAN